MSIQAVAWALAQDIPGTSKLVLVSLANHADHTNGHCWPKAETIAKEASCSVRSVYSHIGALRRNGFVMVQQARGKDGKQRSNNYWLIFDRAVGEWQSVTHNEDVPEPETVVETPEEGPVEDAENVVDPQTANVACGLQPEQIAVGPSATGCSPHYNAEPSGVEPSARARGDTVPDGWTKVQATAAQQQAAEEARRESKPTFVFEGTKAWEAWLDDTKRRTGIRSMPTTTAVVEGRTRVGWWKPSLFPPPVPGVAATGPPKSAEASDGDKNNNQKAG